MRFASLGSGSQGNSLVVEAHHTRVLLDCGFGLAATEGRLARLWPDLDLHVAVHVGERHQCVRHVELDLAQRSLPSTT